MLFHYTIRKGKIRSSSQGTSQYQMMPVGPRCPSSPEPCRRKPQDKERVSKIFPGERYGTVHEAGDKRCSLIKETEVKHPCVICCPNAWTSGTGGGTVPAVSDHSAFESKGPGATVVCHIAARSADRCLQTCVSSWLLEGAGSKIKPGRVTLIVSDYQLVLPQGNEASASPTGI